jgi:predicted membrane protein
MDNNVQERGLVGKIINVILWIAFFVIAINFIPIIFVVIGLVIALIYYFKYQRTKSEISNSSEKSDVDLSE